MSIEEFIQTKAEEIRNMSDGDQRIFWSELTARNFFENIRFTKLMDRMETFLNKQDRSDNAINTLINLLNHPQ